MGLAQKMSVFSQSPFAVLVHPHQSSSFWSFCPGGRGRIKLLFLKFWGKPQFNYESSQCHFRTSWNVLKWVFTQCWVTTKKCPPYPPTRTIIMFISQHLSLTYICSYMCRIELSDLFPSQQVMLNYLVALSSCFNVYLSFCWLSVMSAGTCMQLHYKALQWHIALRRSI